MRKTQHGFIKIKDRIRRTANSNRARLAFTDQETFHRRLAGFQNKRHFKRTKTLVFHNSSACEGDQVMQIGCTRVLAA